MESMRENEHPEGRHRREGQRHFRRRRPAVCLNERPGKQFRQPPALTGAPFE